jgi:hypothetical protein
MNWGVCGLGFVLFVVFGTLSGLVFALWLPPVMDEATNYERGTCFIGAVKTLSRNRGFDIVWYAAYAYGPQPLGCLYWVELDTYFKDEPSAIAFLQLNYPINLAIGDCIWNKQSGCVTFTPPLPGMNIAVGALLGLLALCGLAMIAVSPCAKL